MKATILLAGCGDLGCEIARQLVQAGHKVIGLRRSAKALPDGVVPVKADVTQVHTLQSLAAFNPDILVYCVAADAHSDEAYHAAYVQGLQNVLTALAGCNLRHVFFISSTSVYGQQSDSLLDETSLAIAADFSGNRMLQAEALLNDSHVPTTALRLSGIYGPGRNRMIRLARDPSSWPAVNRWTNRIHRDDAARFTVSLIARALQAIDLSTCYIVTDSCPSAQYEVLLWIASQIGVDTSLINIPLTGGAKRLSNARMLQTGFTLQYPDYVSGYSNLLARDKT